MKGMESMSARGRTYRAHALGGVAVAVALWLSAAPGYAQTPLSALHGAWAGTGTINMANGASERIRCRAAYAVASGGRRMQQNLTCASDSYKFVLASDIAFEGGALTGNWSESSRNVGGGLTGTARGNQIVAKADGGLFSANISLVTQGDKQQVAITSQGGDITGVTITLSKGKGH
jgi:hypothetical protein